LCGFSLEARAQAPARTSINVLVNDAETRQPIPQAHLTLIFVEPGDVRKLKRSKPLSYSAKTNPQGLYRFQDIPKGNVRLIVTAERHQTFSKEYKVETDNPVLEVFLKKPQPLL
jgi:Carboxypeptidase regulatory-like domain